MEKLDSQQCAQLEIEILDAEKFVCSLAADFAAKKRGRYRLIGRKHRRFKTAQLRRAHLKASKNLESKIKSLEALFSRLAHPLAITTEHQPYPVSQLRQRHELVQNRRKAFDADPGKWQPAPEPTMSIVLGTFNRLDILKLAIQSVRNNGISTPYEIIVVDGGSTDGTISWLAQQSDIITIIHHNRQNGKRARSWAWFMNLAFKASHGKLILMISDDCLLLPDAVNAGLESFQKATSAGKNIGGVAFHYRDYPKDDRYYVRKTIGGMTMVNHGFFTRQALEAVGWCEEQVYSFYKADSDLALKIWQAGFEIISSDGSYVEHLVLPEEELRIQNTASMAYDRHAMLNRWEGVFNSQFLGELYNKPGLIYSDHHDASGTADQFAPHLERKG